MSYLNLRDWAVKDRITATSLQDFTDRHNAYTPLTFSGNVKVRGGMLHGMHVHVPTGPPALPREWFPAKITGYNPVSGEDNRFEYGWTEQRRTPDGWEDLPGGRTNLSTTKYALNMTEANNTSEGVQGNSVDHAANYPSGFELRPVRGEPVVRMYVGYDTEGAVAYDFEYVNAEQGPCT